MNYDSILVNIENFQTTYPDASLPEVKNRMKTLDEYLVMAKKIIKRFAGEFLPKGEVYKMANSENAVTEIARHLMMADWKYDETKGRTQYSYRNQCGIWAIRDFLNSSKTKGNKESYSIDFDIPIGTAGDTSPLSSVLEDTTAIDPEVCAAGIERKERVKNYIGFLVKNGKLTPMEEKCIFLKYFKGIDSNVEIGKCFTPRISRQAVQQNLEKAVSRLKQVALGTTEK